MNMVNQISPPTQSPVNFEDEMDNGFSMTSLPKFEGKDVQEFPITASNASIDGSNPDLPVMPFDNKSLVD